MITYAEFVEKRTVSDVIWLGGGRGAIKGVTSAPRHLVNFNLCVPLIVTPKRQNVTISILEELVTDVADGFLGVMRFSKHRKLLQARRTLWW